MQKKAIIAMSGGVDSSVAAYLMVKEGYDCAGATLKLYDNPRCSFPGHRACCTPADTEAVSYTHLKHPLFVNSGCQWKYVSGCRYY